jgi:hypothetical protein
LPGARECSESTQATSQELRALRRAAKACRRGFSLAARASHGQCDGIEGDRIVSHSGAAE